MNEQHYKFGGDLVHSGTGATVQTNVYLVDPDVGIYAHVVFAGVLTEVEIQQKIEAVSIAFANQGYTMRPMSPEEIEAYEAEGVDHVGSTH